MNIHTLEKNNKLFFKILTVFMVFYTILVTICISHKQQIAFTIPKKLKIKSFTKVTVNLSIPNLNVKPQFTPPVKKQEISKVIEPKEIKPLIKKKIKLANKPEIKRSESEIFELEMLKVLGAIDDLPGETKTASKSNIIKNNDFSKTYDTGDTLFNEDTTDDILADLEFISSDSEALETDLSLYENSISFDSKLKIDNKKTRVEKALLASHVDDDIEDEVRTPHFIEEKVLEYANGIKFCYNNRLGLNEKPTGKIIINFTILSSGKTEGIKIISTEIKDHRLDTCILNVVGRWKFPVSTKDKVLVTYPLFLSTDKT